MNAEDCGLGYKGEASIWFLFSIFFPEWINLYNREQWLTWLQTVLKFHDSQDFNEIKKRYFQDGVAFINRCDEQNLLKLANFMGTIVRPRNEKATGTRVSNIRYAPSLEGKGYSSEGKQQLSHLQPASVIF